MKYDFKLGVEEMEVLSNLVGRRLESYRLNDVGDLSYEIFVLRFADTDIEVATKEIVGIDDWFDETNTVEVTDRPNRDSWSRLDKSEPDNGIPAGGFKDFAVDKKVAGISVIIETFSHESDSVEFVRGLIIHFADAAIMFDKGALNWGNIWKVSRNSGLSFEVPAAEFDSREEPGLRSTTRIVQLSPNV